MNQTLFLAVNNFAGEWPWLDQVGIFFAKDFIYILGAFVLLLWFNKQLRLNVYLAFISAGISRLVIVEALKRIIDNPRPFEVISNFQQLLVDEAKGLSFPSGHTVIYFSFAFAFFGTKYFWPFLVLASIGSISRVFVGVHFPWDIITSIFIAAGVVWLVRLFFNKYPALINKFQ